MAEPGSNWGPCGRKAEILELHPATPVQGKRLGKGKQRRGGKRRRRKGNEWKEPGGKEERGERKI